MIRNRNRVQLRGNITEVELKKWGKQRDEEAAAADIATTLYYRLLQG